MVFHIVLRLFYEYDIAFYFILKSVYRNLGQNEDCKPYDWSLLLKSIRIQLA